MQKQQRMMYQPTAPPVLPPAVYPDREMSDTEWRIKMMSFGTYV